VGDSKSWEAPLGFSFSNVSFSENRSFVGSLMMNDVAFKVDKSAVWMLNLVNLCFIIASSVYGWI